MEAHRVLLGVGATPVAVLEVAAVSAVLQQVFVQPSPVQQSGGPFSKGAPSALTT
jgi:hypothetical protein